eukprot:scaffold44496_cov64-Phaeocystis_antarctica.AAC.3
MASQSDGKGYVGLTAWNPAAGGEAMAVKEEAQEVVEASEEAGEAGAAVQGAAAPSAAPEPVATDEADAMEAAFAVAAPSCGVSMRQLVAQANQAIHEAGATAQGAGAPSITSWRPPEPAPPPVAMATCPDSSAVLAPGSQAACYSLAPRNAERLQTTPADYQPHIQPIHPHRPATAGVGAQGPGDWVVAAAAARAAAAAAAATAAATAATAEPGGSMHPAWECGACPAPLAYAYPIAHPNCGTVASEIGACWGALLVQSDGAGCTPHFVPGKLHLKNKR